MKIFFVLCKYSLILVFILNYAYAAVVVTDPGALTQLIAQLSILKQQSQYLFQQLDSLKKLDLNQYQFSHVQDLIKKIDEKLQLSNAISYTAKDIEQRFKNDFSGQKILQNYSEEYKKIVSAANTMQTTLKNTLQVLNDSAKNFDHEVNRLKNIQKQVQNAIGQTQAIQAMSQMASEHVSQLQLLRQTVMTQSNVQVAYYATQIQKEIDTVVAVEKLVDGGKKVLSRTLSGEPLQKPVFK